MKFSNPLKTTLLSACLGFVVLGLTSTSAVAQTNPATTTFNVTANVAKDCIVSATALGFGSYTGAVNNAQSTITVTCTNTTPYTVALGPGNGTGASAANPRFMQNGSALLSYGLYSNSNATTNWGNTTGTGGNVVSGTGTGAAQPLTVYGQIAAAQYVTPGSYTDTIAVSVAY
jgi:spore coat protein U-like protein